MAAITDLPGTLLGEILDLVDLSDMSRVSRTCHTLYESLTARRHRLELLFNENLPECEARKRLQLLKSASIILPSKFGTALENPYAALALYGRCEAGRGLDRAHIVRHIAGQLHPVALGAVLARQPSDNRALRAVRDVVRSRSWSSNDIPPLSNRLRKRIRRIVSHLPSSHDSLDPALCQEVRDGLAHLEPTFARMFPFNELVADRLLQQLEKMGAIWKLADVDVMLALCWRGIRFKALSFAKLDRRHISRGPVRDLICPTLRIDGDDVYELFLLLKDAIYFYRDSQDVFVSVPEFRRRLCQLLTAPLPRFPWIEFRRAFTHLPFHQTPCASIIMNTLIKLASKAHNKRIAAFLLSSAVKRTVADPEDQYDTLRASCVWPHGDQNGSVFAHLQSLDVIWAVLDLDADLGSLFSFVLRRPEVVQHLRSTKFDLLLRMMQRAMHNRRRFYLYGIDHFVDVPEFVTFLENHMGAYLDALGEAFLDRPGTSDMDWLERSEEPPACLRVAMKLPFWPKVVNLQRSQDGATLLHMAFYYQHRGALELLLTCPSLDLYCVDKQGRGPLHYFLSFMPNIDSFRYFLHKLPVGDPSYHRQIATDFKVVFRRSAWSAFLGDCFKLEIMRSLLDSHASILLKYEKRFKMRNYEIHHVLRKSLGLRSEFDYSNCYYPVRDDQVSASGSDSLYYPQEDSQFTASGWYGQEEDISSRSDALYDPEEDHQVSGSGSDLGSDSW